MKKILNFSDWVNTINTEDFTPPQRVVEPAIGDWYPQEMEREQQSKRNGKFAKLLPNSLYKF